MMAAERLAVARSCAVLGTKIETIESIYDEAISLVVLQRPVRPDIAQYLQNLSVTPGKLETRNCVTIDKHQADAVFSVLPDRPGRDSLVEDYRWMLELFSVVTDSDTVGVRMAVTSEQTCPRFHADQVALRLICTWQGPATQWLEHDLIDRQFLGQQGSGGLPDEISGLMKPGARMQALEAFDIGLMKGDAWPGNAGRGLVHRSPAPGVIPRVMITMDALS